MVSTGTEVAAAAEKRVDLPITGMTCAACARRIERRLNKTPGVRRAGVNFATGRATVEYSPEATSVGQLIEAVKDVGYGASEPEADAGREGREAREAEYVELRRRFLAAAALSLPVLVLAMSHGRVPLLDFSGSGWLQLALTTPVVFYSGRQFYGGAWAALRHRAADMNTLIAVGTGAAYLYSAAATIVPDFFRGHGAMRPPVYFEAASVIIALVLLGRLLEARARGRTGAASK
jgi:P-type Cu+ transporter